MTVHLAPYLLLAAAYAFGALPFGLLVARWWAGVDIRQHGSGNIGATNVFRVVSKPAGAVVFLLDVVKGLWPPLAAHALGLSPWWQVAAGMAAIVGHDCSPFLGFRGGKGISTSLGVLFGVAWPVALTAWSLWGVVLAVSGYVSLGSLAAAVSLAPLSWLYYPGDYARLLFCLVASLFSIYRHRANVVRLFQGTEPNFRKGRPADEPAAGQPADAGRAPGP